MDHRTSQSASPVTGHPGTEIDIQKLALEHGDILIVQIAKHLDPKDIHDLFADAMRRADIRGVPMMVGRKGDIELSVVKVQKE